MSGDILKGAKAIAAEIGETEFATFKLLERGHFPKHVAYKWAGRWRFSISAYQEWRRERILAA